MFPDPGGQFPHAKPFFVLTPSIGATREARRCRGGQRNRHQILHSHQLQALLAWHRRIEAVKLAFADRHAWVADPEHAELPVAALLDKTYAKERARLVGERALPGAVSGLASGDTVYLCAADAEGNLVSFIQSLFTGFGSGVACGDTGILLQSRGAGFTLDPAHPNVLAPGKRPFHTIIPAFVTRDGLPLFSFGVMGGGMQPQGHVQVLVNLIDFGMNVQEAGDAPRFHHDGSSEPTGTTMQDGGVVNLESGVPAEVVRELSRKGHRIAHAIGIFGGYQGIWIDHERGVLIGGTESRKDGIALGY